VEAKFQKAETKEKKEIRYLKDRVMKLENK